jgi:hypothetical protein
MSVYGASFARVHSSRATAFDDVSRLLRKTNEAWLAASPANLAVELVVQAFEASDWISIQPALADPLLEGLSRDLSTTALGLRVMDEMVLRFSYSRFDNGHATRALEYSDDGNPKGHGQWTRVEGTPEAWENTLFSPRLMELYRRRAPDEVREGSAEGRIVPGASIPWPYHASTLAEIADALALPWRPMDNRFLPAAQTEVIPGSPERWKAFRHQRLGPWRRFWSRGKGGSAGG